MERIAPFTLARPATVAEASALLSMTPGARLVAGGTDLVPNLRDGLGAPPLLVDLSRVVALARIEVRGDGIAIGAGVTLARLAGDGSIRTAVPILAEAAALVAGPAHRTVATIGGNLCLDTRCAFYNQSEWWRKANAYCLKHGGDICHVAPQGERCHAAFSGDLAPALLALDAAIDVAGSQGARRIPLSALYADDGRRPLTLAPGDILTSVVVPSQPANSRAAYRKARARGAIDFPLAGVAVRLAVEKGAIADLRVALTGTNSRPFLLEGAACLVGRPIDEETLATLAKLVQKQTSPMRTTVTSSNYRRQVAVVLAQRLVRELAS
jgi:4-hydroxybenzoyl-CoA reductase subunit beta